MIGFIFGFALFQLLAIPMTFIECKFTTLTYTWIAIEIIFAFISIKMNDNSFIQVLKNDFSNLVKFPKILTISLVVLIFIQGNAGFKYMHEDYDDSNFLAKAKVSIDTNSLFKYNDIGEENESLPSRQVLSPFPVYTATLSVAIGIHPLILARTVYPIIFVFMAYMIYGMIGNILFNGDNEKNIVFLIILSLLYIWGGYSKYTNFVFLLYRIWQGKAVLANIIIPFIWLIFLKYINSEASTFSWILLIIVVLSADLTSSMALSLGTLSILILSLVWAIKDKKISYLFKTAICIIPNIIYGVIYLFIR